MYQLTRTGVSSWLLSILLLLPLPAAGQVVEYELTIAEKEVNYPPLC